MLTAQGQVTTEKAQRYLKALCNHFSHKVQASYDENNGHVEFGFGVCEMKAEATTLSFAIEAEDAESFEQVKFVVADHLERFSGDEALKVSWT
jgi:hypothetical protein